MYPSGSSIFLALVEPDFGSNSWSLGDQANCTSRFFVVKVTLVNIESVNVIRVNYWCGAWNGGVWKDLLDWQWSLPEDTDRAPEASLVHTDEAESLEGHLLWVVVETGVHELVGWYPLGESTGVLPHVKVVLSFFTSILVSSGGASGVHVAAIKESTLGTVVGEFSSSNWALILASISHTFGGHELWWSHVEGGGEGLSELCLVLFGSVALVNMDGGSVCKKQSGNVGHFHGFVRSVFIIIARPD